jgi:hypothetical protein
LSSGEPNFRGPESWLSAEVTCGELVRWWPRIAAIDVAMGGPMDIDMEVGIEVGNSSMGRIPAVGLVNRVPWGCATYCLKCAKALGLSLGARAVMIVEAGAGSRSYQEKSPGTGSGEVPEGFAGIGMRGSCCCVMTACYETRAKRMLKVDEEPAPVDERAAWPR